MTTLAALLLFTAGVGLGYIVGVTVSWHRWARALEAERETLLEERAAHQRICDDVTRITREIDDRLDLADAMVFHVQLFPAKRQPAGE